AGGWRIIGDLVELAANGPGPGVSGFGTSVEAMTLLVLFVAPHITLGLAAVLASLVFFREVCLGRGAAFLWLAVCVLTLALVHPSSSPPLPVAFGLASMLTAIA